MVRAAVAAHPDEHMVKPEAGLYLRFDRGGDDLPGGNNFTPCGRSATSWGFICTSTGRGSGARLLPMKNDIRPSDLPACCDAFYVGGTKNGAMFGEALVIVNEKLKPDFRYGIKQRGGMLAKGRLLGVQFGALFKGGLEDSVWMEIGRHENGLARKLQDGIVKAGYPLLVRSPSNQVFPIFPDGLVEKLAEGFKFEVQKKFPDGKTCIRLVTSWATEEEAVDAFLAAI